MDDLASFLKSIAPQAKALARLADMADELVGLERKSARTARALQDAQAQIEAAKTELASIKAESVKANDALQKAKADEHSLRDNTSSIERKTLEEANTQASAIIARAQAEGRKILDDLAGEISSREAAVRKLDEQIETKKAAYETAVSNMKSISARLAV